MGLLAIVIEGIAVLLAATLAFDVLHVTLHRLQSARAPWLRAIGAWHAVHHRFLGTDLAVDEGLIGANLRWHVVPEYATHVVVTTGLLLVLPAGPVVVALTLETLVFLLILRDRGLDVNHRPRTRIPAYRPSVVCMPAYHALHHARPTGFFGSWIKIVDMVLGTTVALRGRSAAIVGVPDELGRAMRDALAAETGSKIAVVEPGVGAVRAAAGEVELLVVIPAADPSAGTILPEWIEAAIAVTGDRLVPIEVWAVLPDGGTFVAEGRGYLDDARVIYRHVVIPRPLPADLIGMVRSVVARVRHGAHRVHAGPIVDRARFRYVTWRGARPRRHGPRVAALA